MNPVKKEKAVIFDCDGVMFDSRDANRNYYNHILAHFGLSAMEEESVSFVHMHTADESIRHLFYNTGYLKEALDYKMQMDYAPFVRDMIIEPGLKELLESLRPRFGLAIATNRSNTIGKVLEHNGLEGYFDIVVSSLDVMRPKPHPEALLKILAFFDIGPTDAYYVGDSMVDYRTARACGVVFVSYKNRELDADYHAEGMMDIAVITAG